MDLPGKKELKRLVVSNFPLLYFFFFLKKGSLSLFTNSSLLAQFKKIFLNVLFEMFLDDYNT